MESGAEFFACRIQQAIIAEPVVTHDQDGGIGKGVCYFHQHGDSLVEFVLERHCLLALGGVDGFLVDGSLGQVET